MSLFIDIHCHLDYLQDADSAVYNAGNAGVKVIVANGLDKDTNRKALKLSEQFPMVKAALGIYPVFPVGENGNFDVDDELRFIEKNKDRIVALGEVGLDGIDQSRLCEQKAVFQKIIELSERLKKPMIIHS